MGGLRLATPYLHGSRVRLRPGHDGKAHFYLVERIDDAPVDEALTVFLPLDQGPALRDACQAFNAVMDLYESRASGPAALPSNVVALPRRETSPAPLEAG